MAHTLLGAQRPFRSDQRGIASVLYGWRLHGKATGSCALHCIVACAGDHVLVAFFWRLCLCSTRADGEGAAEAAAGEAAAAAVSTFWLTAFCDFLVRAVELMGPLAAASEATGAGHCTAAAALHLFTRQAHGAYSVVLGGQVLVQ